MQQYENATSLAFNMDKKLFKIQKQFSSNLHPQSRNNDDCIAETFLHKRRVKGGARNGK